MKTVREHYWLMLIGLLSAIGLYAGWRLFWFMTDDAFIAFRYVSNSILGYGYVWNAPPFLPVEGYTSFLWVVLHDIIWRLTGLEPPLVANWLALLFSGLTLLVIGRAVMRMQLGRELERHRLLFLALVLAGTLTNRTFLAWTSSGLETALFNFMLSVWILAAIRIDLDRPCQLWLLTSSATLTYLTRPDGLLVLAATGLLALVAVLKPANDHAPRWKRWLALIPLAIPPGHLLWRHSFYGEWLPNTYYAKYVEAWPEAGLRYLASFVMEYALWVWGLTALGVLFSWWRHSNRKQQPVEPGATIWDQLQRRLGPAIVAGVIILHVGYYTLVIGGDHFEYRVFSYLIPWALVSFVWLLNRLVKDWVVAATVFSLFLLISWPLPWTHWSLSHNLYSRDDTHVMQVPIAEEFPAGVRWYVEIFDDLQSWLITHHVCMRHQEHKVFYMFNVSKYPGRSLRKIPLAGKYPTLVAGSVGVPSWVFPRVAIIDQFGLNDYVIARHAGHRGDNRRMAHDRYAPPNYTYSLAINYVRLSRKATGFMRRDYELTADEIAANEAYWVDKIVKGHDAPLDYLALCRIGETYNRSAAFDTAAVWLNKAIAFDSTRPRAWVGLARSVGSRKLYDSALTLLQRAVTMDPDNPLIHSRMGVASAEIAYLLYEEDRPASAGWFDSAENHLEQALALDSCWSEALTEIASIRIFVRDSGSSLDYLDRLANCPDASPAMLYLLGERYRLRMYPELALKAYAAAIKRGLNQIQRQFLLQKYPELNERLQREAGITPEPD